MSRHAAPDQGVIDPGQKMTQDVPPQHQPGHPNRKAVPVMFTALILAAGMHLTGTVNTPAEPPPVPVTCPAHPQMSDDPAFADCPVPANDDCPTGMRWDSDEGCVPDPENEGSDVFCPTGPGTLYADGTLDCPPPADEACADDEMWDGTHCVAGIGDPADTEGRQVECPHGHTGTQHADGTVTCNQPIDPNRPVPPVVHTHIDPPVVHVVVAAVAPWHPYPVTTMLLRNHGIAS